MVFFIKVSNLDKSIIKEKSHSPLVVWGVFVIFYMYQFIARSAFPAVLTEEYMKYFCLDAQGVGGLVSCYYVLYTLIQIPAGIIIDRFSLKLIAPLAVLICTTGVLVFILTRDVFIARIGQMLVGFGSAFAFLMVLKVSIGQFSPERRAVMLTCAISIGCLGPVIFSPLISVIVKTFYWKTVMMVYTIAGYALACVVWSLLKTEKRSEVKQRNSVVQSLKIIVSSPQAWILVLFALMQYSPLSALADLWGTSYIKKLCDADVTAASSANSMIYLGMIIGGPLFSYLAVYIDSYKKTMLISSICCALVFTAVLLSDHGVSLYMVFILFFLMGLFSSATLHFPLSVVLFPKEIHGALSGFINMGSMLSGVILMPFIGYLVDTSWNGAIENGIRIYSLADFKFGLLSVFVALLLGIGVAFFMKDKSPKAAE